MENKILDAGYRAHVLEEMRGGENEGRKLESLRQVEIFNDRIHQHVWERMRRNFSENTLTEMPIVSSINLARRIAKQESSIYKSPPTRSWSNLSDEQIEVVELIYKDMGIDSKMLKSNESFKLQNQNHVMIVPKKGKLVMRVMRNHHLDSLPESDDPESSMGYIVGSFDKGTNLESRKNESGGSGYRGKIDSFTDLDSNGFNEKIGDPEDFQNERWAWWSDEYNFITDGRGVIIESEDDDEMNAAEINPIVDISIEKDFEYWVRQGASLSEFTVEYNSYWSSVQQVVMMQGFAQSYLKGPDDMIPDVIQIGPNQVLKLPIDPNNPTDIEFGYASPNPDLSGTIQAGEALLANFLSSRGLDPSLVSGKAQGNKFSSGTERLLSMIENFDASKSDYDTYKVAETKIWEIVKAWHNALRNDDLLDAKYKTAELPEDAEINVEFAGPEMIQSEAEKLENIQTKIEMGLISTVEAIQEIRGVDKDTAKEIMKTIEEEEFASKPEPINDNSEDIGLSEEGESES